MFCKNMCVVYKIITALCHGLLVTVCQAVVTMPLIFPREEDCDEESLAEHQSKPHKNVETALTSKYTFRKSENNYSPVKLLRHWQFLLHFFSGNWAAILNILL